VLVLHLIMYLGLDDGIHIPRAMGTAMEHCLRRLRPGRKAQCQSLQRERLAFWSSSKKTAE
jgi:hypothetical protein